MGRALVCDCDHTKSDHLRIRGNNDYTFTRCRVPGCLCKKYKFKKMVKITKGDRVSLCIKNKGTLRGPRKSRFLKMNDLDENGKPNS